MFQRIECVRNTLKDKSGNFLFWLHKQEEIVHLLGPVLSRDFVFSEYWWQQDCEWVKINQWRLVYWRIPEETVKLLYNLLFLFNVMKQSNIKQMKLFCTDYWSLVK